MDTTKPDVNALIDTEIDSVSKVVPLRPLRSNTTLVELYVKKIEGRYSVSGAKRDTDYANDLLYIAYNTTPQDCDGIRNQIDHIMDDLVTAQRGSMLAMERAKDSAEFIVRKLDSGFKKWQLIRPKTSTPEDIKSVRDFVKSDMLAMANAFLTRALAVKADLDSIAAGYDQIIQKISSASATSQTALAKRMQDAQAVQAEITKAAAKQASLEVLVADLKGQVEKYDKMAKDFAGRAEGAENKAFIMSIIQVAAQMLSAAIPAVVTALTGSATGGASVLAAAAVSTTKRVVGDKNDTPAAAPGSDAEAAKLQVEMATKQAAVTESGREIAKLKKDLGELESKLEKELAAAPPAGAVPPAPPVPAGTAQPAVKDPAVPKEVVADPAAPQESPAVKGFRQRIADAKTAVQKEEDKRALLVGALSGMQASLAALDKGLGKLSDTQQSAAAELRVMQMKMLDKVEAYEKERRTQNAELSQIKALLSGHLQTQEVVRLAVQSLNLCITALKRSQEIVRELAAFFLCFANYMHAAVEDVTFDIEEFEEFVGSGSVLAATFPAFISATDRFFFGRAAEWLAVKGVSEKFSASFNDGYTQLTKLQANYLHGAALETYLKGAGARIDEIIADRERASRQKIITLEQYRSQLLLGASAA